MICRSPVGNTPHMLHAFGLFCADGVDLHHARHLLGFASGHFARFSCQNHLRLLFRHACIYMPDITASGKRGKEEKVWTNNFFAISHNDIIKNFNECQANFPFLQNYLEWRLLLFASFQYFLIVRFLPAVMLPTYGVSLSRSFSYSWNPCWQFSLHLPQGNLSGQSFTQGLLILLLLSGRKICVLRFQQQTAGFRAIRCCTI